MKFFDLIGLVRGQSGSLAGPRGTYGHALAVEAAIAVAREGGNVILFTTVPPAQMPHIDRLDIAHYPQGFSDSGTLLYLHLWHHLYRLGEGELRDLTLIVIDKALSADAALSMPSLAHYYNIAVAYLPTISAQEQIERGLPRAKKAVTPYQLFVELRQIVDPVERQERVDSIKFALRYGKDRSYFAGWTDDEIRIFLRRLDEDAP